MNRLLLTVALAALAVPAPAHATHSGYLGGCSKSVVAVPPPVAPGQDAYAGAVTLAAIATVNNAVAPTVTISVDCALHVDGVLTHWGVLSASGTGVVAAAGPIGYTASGGLVEVCTYAVVDGHPATVTCV